MIFKGDKSIKGVRHGSDYIKYAFRGKNLIFPKARRVKAFEKVPVDISEFLPLKESNRISWSFFCASDNLRSIDIPSNVSVDVNSDSGKYYQSSITFLDLDLISIDIDAKEILSDSFFKNTLYATIWKGKSDLLIFSEIISKFG